jgi:signal transduction histidine kinase
MIRPAMDHLEAMRIEDLRRSEQVMVLVRGVAAVFAFGQVLVYSARPYPPGVEEIALGLAGFLAAVNLVIWLLARRIRTLPQMRALSLGALSLDILVASGFVFLYAFDPISALWAILYVLPLEGAIRFHLPGALGTWGAVAALYTVREVWGSARYDYLLEWNSITFRMGIGLLIALVAGLMARNLTQQRALVEDTLGRLRRVDRLRSTLVSTLAHDVRSPLTAIRGTLTTILRHGDRLEPTMSQELLAGADRQAARLDRLASDLLDLARLERGRLKLALEDVPVRDSITQSVSYLDRGDRFGLDIEPDLVVRADPGRLEQIVVNLASNALRHGAEPFGITARRVNDHVAISVLDQGQGIPPESRDELFEPFRAEEGRGSVGLGLAIVKALAEAHGGGIDYRENEPRGACFTVTLPRAEVRRPANQQPQPAT